MAARTPQSWRQLKDADNKPKMSFICLLQYWMMKHAPRRCGVKGISTMIIAYFQVDAALAHQTNNNNNFSDSKSWENSTFSELFLLFITG